MWERTIARNPDYLFAYMGLTAAHQILGQENRARECTAELIRIKPNFSVRLVENQLMLKTEEDKKIILEAFRKAGIPD